MRIRCEQENAAGGTWAARSRSGPAAESREPNNHRPGPGAVALSGAACYFGNDRVIDEGYSTWVSGLHPGFGLARFSAVEGPQGGSAGACSLTLDAFSFRAAGSRT
jgi:hypothetical protein